MPSLYPGYEYDIFISYRQKDNKYDGWVTAFVSNLKKELEATFKEDVSIYFDENPNDGLLETHDVNKSLEGKLKCLLFIPIISQTYCDPRSFAWQHEFCAFNRFASEDKIGRDIRLSNGNVASRILPVKIHDLDHEDERTVERQIGGALRGVEFIYKEPGVNRPLRPSDNKNDNLNKTDYRNQVNKVANAIKEIVLAMKNPPSTFKPTTSKPKARTSKPNILSRGIVALLAIVAMMVMGYYVIFSGPEVKDPSTSALAVLPFLNNTGNPEMDYHGVGIASAIQVQLSTSNKFRLLSALAATLRYEHTKKAPKEIGQELGVDYVIAGVYQQLGDKLRVDIELVDASNEKVIWNFTIEGNADEVGQLNHEIATAIAERFSASTLETENVSISLEAYAHYIRGKKMMENTFSDSADWVVPYEPVIDQFEKAISIDSLYMDAWTDLISVECFIFQGKPELRPRIQKHFDYFLRHFAQDSWQRNLVQGQFVYRVEHNYPEAVRYFQKVLDTNPNSEHAVYALSTLYRRQQLDLAHAIQLGIKLIELNPSHAGHWANLGFLLDLYGAHAESLKAFTKSWELSHSRSAGMSAIAQALLLELRIDQLPKNLTEAFNDHLIMFQQAFRRDWKSAKQSGLNLKEYGMVSMFCWALDQKDSSKYWAIRALQNKQADSLFYFAMAGKKDRATKLDVPAESPGWGDQFQFRQAQLENAILVHDHVLAVSLLRELIRDYPQADNQTWFRTLPFYDRIKKESHEFNTLINRPRPVAVVELGRVLRF